MTTRAAANEFVDAIRFSKAVVAEREDTAEVFDRNINRALGALNLLVRRLIVFGFAVFRFLFGFVLGLFCKLPRHDFIDFRNNKIPTVAGVIL